MFLLTHVGLLGVFCKCLLESLDRLPGDARTMVGVLTYDSSLHFYNLNVSGSLYVDLVYTCVIYKLALVIMMFSLSLSSPISLSLKCWLSQMWMVSLINMKHDCVYKATCRRTCMIHDSQCIV